MRNLTKYVQKRVKKDTQLVGLKTKGVFFKRQMVFLKGSSCPFPWWLWSEKGFSEQIFYTKADA